MPIPELNEHGLLPPGIHDCTLDELEQRFDGGFGSHRYDLVLRLRRFVLEVRKSKLVGWLAVDGSFVTAKELPGDIDIVLVLVPSFDPAQALLPDDANILSSRWVARRFEFDSLWAAEGTPLFVKRLSFFQQVKHRSELTKGILKVIP